MCWTRSSNQQESRLEVTQKTFSWTWNLMNKNNGSATFGEHFSLSEWKYCGMKRKLLLDKYFDLTSWQWHKNSFHFCSFSYLILKDAVECGNKHLFCHTCVFAWTMTYGENSQTCPVCRCEQRNHYAPNLEINKKISEKVLVFSRALLVARSDFTSHSAMSSIRPVVCLSMVGPMLNWPPPYPLPTQHNWILKVTPMLTSQPAKTSLFLLF